MAIDDLGVDRVGVLAGAGLLLLAQRPGESVESLADKVSPVATQRLIEAKSARPV